MPPKKKKKSKKVKDPEQEATEANRKELIQQAQHLTNEIDKEKKATQELSSSLDQTKVFWDMEKKNLEVCYTEDIGLLAGIRVTHIVHYQHSTVKEAALSTKGR